MTDAGPLLEPALHSGPDRGRSSSLTENTRPHTNAALSQHEEDTGFPPEEDARKPGSSLADLRSDGSEFLQERGRNT